MLLQWLAVKHRPTDQQADKQQSLISISSVCTPRQRSSTQVKDHFYRAEVIQVNK